MAIKKKIKRNFASGKTSKKYCPDCGFRVRSKNHEEGDHHSNGKSGHYKTPGSR